MRIYRFLGLRIQLSLLDFFSVWLNLIVFGVICPSSSIYICTRPHNKAWISASENEVKSNRYDSWDRKDNCGQWGHVLSYAIYDDRYRDR